MRYAILSDVHGNDEALRAVLADIQRISLDYGAAIDQVWCLGDVVGYGPEPSACVRRIRARCDICIPGNHDWAAVGRLDLADFSAAAANSAVWTRDLLKQDERTYLKSLPELTRVGDFTLAHGSPSNPIWEYLTSADAAAPNFAAFDTLFCVVGHSHLPVIFLQPADVHLAARAPINRAIQRQVTVAMALPGGPSLSLQETGPEAVNQEWGPCQRVLPREGAWRIPHGYRAILNPGSVGQPRDHDPRASYVIYDSQRGVFEFRRVRYDIAATQRKITEYGLSPKLAERLARGV